MMKLFKLTLLCCFSIVAGHTQVDLTLSNFSDLWQKNHLNPAHSPDHNFTIAIPGIYFGFHHSGEAFNELWSINNQTLTIDTKKWVDNLDDQNDVVSRFEMPTVEVAWKNGPFTLSLGHSFRNRVLGTYSRGLIELVHDGNAPYIGDTMNLTTRLNWRSMSSIHAGMSWGLENIRIGARLHYLNGVQFFESDPGEVQLYTDDDVYQMTFLTDFRMRSSSFVSAEEVDALNFEFTGLETFDLFTSNQGLSLDLGAQVDIGERLMAEVSVLDLGFINWDEVETYESNGVSHYDGVEVENIANFDSLSFSEALDTIGRVLGVEEGRQTNQRESLNSRIYLGLHYQMTSRLHLSATYANSTFFEDSFDAFGIGARYQITQGWELGTMVASRYGQWGWGLNTSVRLGFVQLYFASDDLISTVGLNDLGNGNIRVGMNLVFGRDSENDEN